MESSLMLYTLFALFLEYGIPIFIVKGSNNISNIHTKLGSFAFSILVVPLSIRCVMDPKLYESSFSSTELSKNIIIISISFFSWVLYKHHKQGNFLMIFHAILSLSGFLSVIILECGWWELCGTLIMEFSTPFLQARWYQYHVSKRRSTVMDLLFVSSFFLSRIIWGYLWAFLCIERIPNMKMPYFMYIMLFMITAMNTYWAGQIIMKILKP